MDSVIPGLNRDLKKEDLDPGSKAGMTTVDSIEAYDQHRATIFYPKTDISQNVRIYPALRTTLDQSLQQNLAIVHDICTSWWGPSPARIVPIASGGTFHLLYKIEFAPSCHHSLPTEALREGRGLEPGSPPESFIIRLNRLPAQHRAWEFLIDEWIYPKLASLALSCPSIITVDCSRDYLQTDYQIMTYVHGKMLTGFQDPETQYMQPVLLQAIGKYVAQVHTIKLAGFGPLAVASLADSSPFGIHGTWQDYIFLRLDEHIDECVAIKAITIEEAAIIKNIFRDYSKIYDCTNPVLLHGDLGNHNFLSADGISINALIDWEDCMSGDPVFDIAFWGTFFRDHMLKDFLSGYTKAATLPGDFELRYWLYYLRIALSKTVHRFRFGYHDHPGLPPASLRIQRALGHVVQD